MHFSYSIFFVKTQNWFHEFFAPIFFKTDSQRPVFWAAAAARTQQSAPYFTSHPTRRPPRSWDISPTTVYAVCCAGLRPAAADPEEFAGSKTLFTQLNWERRAIRTLRFLVFLSVSFWHDYFQNNNISWIHLSRL